jgi:hypothetical protein
MNSIFKNMLSQYSPTTKEEKANAMHEVMQQTVLRIVPQGQHFINRMLQLTDRKTRILTKVP